MKADKELLELAVKAVGYEDLGWYDNKMECFVDNEGWIFDPLNDDGDALRLAVSLRIGFTLIGNDAIALGKTQCNERIKGDTLAATRRAIVRAAAAIGELMQ